MGDFFADVWAMAQEMSPLIAGLTASGNKQEADKLRRQVLESAKGLNPDQLEKLNGALYQTGNTEFDKFKEDPLLRESELDALKRYKDIADSGGMDAIAKARLSEAHNDASQYERGQREAVVNDFTERGMGGSGAELNAQLQAQQAGANREASGGVQAAADAEMRALQAIRDGSGLAGRVRGEDSDVAKFRSSSQDSINKFNANQRMGADQYNADLAKTKYQQQVQRQAAMAGAAKTQADSEDKEAQRKRDYFGGTLQAIAKAGGF